MLRMPSWKNTRICSNSPSTDATFVAGDAELVRDGSTGVGQAIALRSPVLIAHGFSEQSLELARQIVNPGLCLP